MQDAAGSSCSLPRAAASAVCNSTITFQAAPETCDASAVFQPRLELGSCVSCADSVAGAAGLTCLNGTVVRCPAGFYCPINASVGTVEQLPCVDGEVCLGGFTEPVRCANAIWKLCDGSKVTLTPFVLILVVALAVGIIIAHWVLALHHRKMVRQALKVRHQVIDGSKLGESFSSETPAVDIAFEDVGLTLKSGDAVLTGITGSFPAGSLVALMGPSGGGKTTFLNALMGRVSYGDVTGTIAINGHPGGLADCPSHVGFVPQDDIVHPNLSVFENLFYHALLRLTRSSPRPAKVRHVMHVLEVLRIEHIRDSLVGDATRRGISGGQKKRVNIGMELVAMPAVCFMDEPTSGLDGAATLQLAQCLGQLRRSGLTIVCVIHQPRLAVYQEFTHLLLLGKGGQQVYCGAAHSIETYLTSLGFRLPAGENIADWMIDAVCGIAPRYNRDGTEDTTFNAPADLFENWTAKYKSTQVRWDGVAAAQGGGGGGRRGSSAPTLPGVATAGRRSAGAPAGAPGATPPSPPSPLRRQSTRRGSCIAAPMLRPNATFEWRHPELDGRAGRKTSTAAAAAAAAGGAEGGKLAPRDVHSRRKQAYYLTGRTFRQHDMPTFIACCAALFAEGAIFTALFAHVHSYSYALLLSRLSGGEGGAPLYFLIVANYTQPLFTNDRLHRRREFRAGFSSVSYWLAKNAYAALLLLFLAASFASAVYLCAPPLQPFYTFLITNLLASWFWSGAAMAASVACPSPMGATLLLIFWPLFEPTLEGHPSLGTTPRTSPLSVATCGRWYRQALLAAELHALPAQVAAFDEVATQLHERAMNTHHADMLRNLLAGWGALLAWGLVFRSVALLLLVLSKYDRSVAARTLDGACGAAWVCLARCGLLSDEDGGAIGGAIGAGALASQDPDAFEAAEEAYLARALSRVEARERGAGAVRTTSVMRRFQAGMAGGAMRPSRASRMPPSCGLDDIAESRETAAARTDALPPRLSAFAHTSWHAASEGTGSVSSGMLVQPLDRHSSRKLSTDSVDDGSRRVSRSVSCSSVGTAPEI